MTFDLRAWGERHKTEETPPWQLLGIGRTSFYKYCAAGSLPKWLVLACERLDDEWMPIESAKLVDGEQYWLSLDYGAGDFRSAQAYGIWSDGDWFLDVTESGDLYSRQAAIKDGLIPAIVTHVRRLPKTPATSAPQSQEK